MGKHFKFSYTVPSLDWFEIKNVILEENDYCYYRLERRNGPTWYIIGRNLVEKPDFHWKETEIGCINDDDLLRFIKWCESEIGNKIVEIKVLSGSFNIFDEISTLSESIKKGGLEMSAGIKHITDRLAPTAPSKKEDAVQVLNRDFNFIDTSFQTTIAALIEEMHKCEIVADKLKIIDKIIELFKIKGDI